MHLMYVDESGDCGYPRTGGFPAAGGPTRFYVRCGLIVHAWKWTRVDRLIRDFKLSRGLRWDDEIKATHLRAGKGAFEGWSPADRRVFLLDLLESVRREMEIALLVVVIDKTRVDRDQRERYTNPAVRSLELLLERYNGYLTNQRDKSGLVILDSVEVAGDERLRHFQGYLLQFSDHLEPRRIVEATLFMPSHTTNLLQLADICANVIYRYHARGGENEEEFERIREKIAKVKTWP